MNIILILIIIIIIKTIFNTLDTFLNETNNNIDNIDNDISNYDDIFTNDDQRNCSIFGCSSIRSQNDNYMKYIGDDKDNNKIFKYENKIFKHNNNKFYNIIPNESEIKYLNESILVPVHYDNKNLNIKINFLYNDYNYVGIAANNYYHLEFLVYAKPYDGDSTLNDKLFEYIFIKIIDNEYKIYYKLPPRTKINKLEAIWISYGNYQLGPLVFY
jgi:hypothetical protein